MADISKINIGNTTYNLKDTNGRSGFRSFGSVDGQITVGPNASLNYSTVGGRILALTISGSSVKDGNTINSLGDNGLKIASTNAAGTISNEITITTGVPLRSTTTGDKTYDALYFDSGIVITRCYYDESDGEVKALATPIRTRLSEAELEAYKTFKSMYETTVVKLIDSNGTVYSDLDSDMLHLAFDMLIYSGSNIQDLCIAEMKTLTNEIGRTITQKETLPAASHELLGKIYQFVGVTTSSYTNGFFYKCVEGSTPGTYEWQAVNVQAGGGDQLVWLGTRAEHTAAEQAGTLPADAIIGIEDEQSSGGGGAQIDDEHVSTTTTYSSEKIESLFELPLKTFGGCTDEELVEIIAKADAGELNPSNYWAVGDRRSVTFSAMATYGDLPDTHASQAVDLVIWHVGLYRDINDKIVNFVVGFATPLIEQGRMNNTSFKPASWHNCERRQWCNITLYNATPQSIRPIFKQFKTITGTDAETNAVTVDNSYFSLPASKEIIGTNEDYVVPAEFNLLTLFTYFETATNRNIKINNTNVKYWVRSPFYGSTSSRDSFRTKVTNTSTSTTATSMTSQAYIVPFGCI